jgi:hypothetical protein
VVAHSVGAICCGQVCGDLQGVIPTHEIDIDRTTQGRMVSQVVERDLTVPSSNTQCFYQPTHAPTHKSLTRLLFSLSPTQLALCAAQDQSTLQLPCQTPENTHGCQNLAKVYAPTCMRLPSTMCMQHFLAPDDAACPLASPDVAGNHESP